MTAASRSATVSLSITAIRSGRPAELASAKRLLLPPISARRLSVIAALPRLTTLSLANRLPCRQDGTHGFPLGCGGSIRPRHAENVLGEVGQDQVGGDGGGPVEPGLPELALDVEFLGEAEAAVGLQAGVCGRPGGVGGEELGQIGLGAAVAPGLVERSRLAYHQLGRAHLRIGARDRKLHALVLADQI